MDEVFVWEADAELVPALKNALRDYLLGGDSGRGVVGLNGVGDANEESFVGLRFQMAEGTGVPGDEGYYERARVIFPDDEMPGVPVARVSVERGDQSSASGGDEVLLWDWVFIIDCTATGSDGALTVGEDAKSAEGRLSSWIRRMIVTSKGRDALEARGFLNAKLRVQSEKQKDGVFRNPLQLMFLTAEEQE